MSLDTLKARLPDYAKDLRLNLSSLATEQTLTEQQRAGTFIASALAARNPEVTDAIMAQFARVNRFITFDRGYEFLKPFFNRTYEIQII